MFPTLEKKPRVCCERSSEPLPREIPPSLLKARLMADDNSIDMFLQLKGFGTTQAFWKTVKNGFKKVQKFISARFDNRRSYKPFSTKATEFRDTLFYARSNAMTSYPSGGSLC
ncbi:unnamed protein product [Enterobius vermicularis]|uniref:Uncharacterized protein n=1 Tax=Enterobius vermicularis TaxID=51028 RepID=A0A0N4V6V8_ENTVE|nr:unnamed protein product [Enterobius vermicularis]